MPRVPQLVQEAHLVSGSVENFLFLMCALVEGMRGNLDREEYQSCFMNAFLCTFDLAKEKYKGLNSLHFILEAMKLSNFSVAS